MGQGQCQKTRSEPAEETRRAQCEASPVNSNFTLHTSQRWGRDPDVIALPPKQAKFFSPGSYGCTMFPTQLPRSLQILRRDALTGTPLGSRLGFFEEIGARHPSIHRSILALDPHKLCFLFQVRTWSPQGPSCGAPCPSIQGKTAQRTRVDGRNYRLVSCPLYYIIYAGEDRAMYLCWLEALA